MASFGRRPKKDDKRPTPGDAPRKTDTFRRMLEEEAERKEWAKDAEEKPDEEAEAVHEVAEPKHQGRNPRVFFQIEIRGRLTGKLVASGRLEFELYAKNVPKTAENVRCLCTGEKGKSLHYENSRFHRIVPGLFAQGGDITFGDGGGADGDGNASGRSIYGSTFSDEGFEHKHDRRGILSMANTGPNSNNSQVLILFASAPQLDRKNVVVGKMTNEGDSILDKIEEAGSKSGRVDHLVSIVECGQVGVAPKPRPPSRSRSRDRGFRGKGGKGRRH